MIRLRVTSHTCTRHFAVWCGACSPDRENEFFIITSQSRIIFGVYAIIFIIVILFFEREDRGTDYEYCLEKNTLCHKPCSRPVSNQDLPGGYSGDVFKGGF
jgi:hypothetical protein